MTTTPSADRGRLARLFRRASRGGLPSQGSLRWSFNWAFEGIVYVLRTQRNMQIHFASVPTSIFIGPFASRFTSRAMPPPFFTPI